MRRQRLARAVGLLLVLLWAPACGGKRLPTDVRAALAGAAEIELLSLDPGDWEGQEKGPDAFHGWKVLGKTTLKEKSDRDKVVAALLQGVRDSDGSVAACFIPRHGIRATHAGQTVGLVVCFECLSMQIYVNGEARGVAKTTGEPAAFNQVLKDAGVPLPKKEPGRPPVQRGA